MTDLLIDLIQESDAAWASQLLGLGLNGFAPVDGDDSRLRAILNLDSADYEACPGSGKTTLLVAKLAALAMRWPYRQRGICVLSHTNAARSEIENRLSGSAAGIDLLRYPHFIGTIHSFVNEYLAIPWLRSKGNPVRLIDTQFVLRKRMASLERKWKYSLEQRHLNEYALTYDKPDYTGDNKGNLRRDTPLYQRLVEAAKRSSEQGYFCFNEMFVWANELLDARAETTRDLRARFPILFIDEAQDNSEEQSSLVHRIFRAGDEPSRCQRFGDSNQAIFSNANQEGAETDAFPSAPIHNLPRSYRFSQGLADEVKGFGVTPQDLVGAGPTSSLIRAAPKAPTLFLFDDRSVREVLTRYGEHLVLSFNEQELANGTYTAIAGVHEMDQDDHIPRAMGHYAPSYDAASLRKESSPRSLANCLAKARLETEKNRNTYAIVNSLATAIFTLVDMLGIAHSSPGRRSPHKRLVEILDGSTALEEYLALINQAISVKGNFNEVSWNAEMLPSIRSVASELSGHIALTGDAEAFLEWPQVAAVDDDGNQNPSLKVNVFSHPLDEPKVHIRLGSIHSVKGETHTATLVLESYFHRHHLSELKPWLLGTKSGGAATNARGKVVKEGKRIIGRLKLHYVGMTRPSHLLCIAMRRDHFENEELRILETRGWRIINC